MGAKKASRKSETERVRLQRETVVQTALKLMNQIGLDELSLRRLATELNVQAPALYWHFKNKQELLDEMAQAMLLNSPAPDADEIPSAEWSDVLMRMGISLRKALLQYRDGARLMASADVSKVGMVTLDLALGILVKAGFSHRLALIGILTIVNFTLGFTFEEQTTVIHDDDLARLQSMVSSNDLPHLQEAFQGNIAPIKPDEEFAASLSLIIAGLKAQQT